MSGEVAITSKQNERVKAAKRLRQKKYRDQQGLFCLEGVRIVEEALRADLVRQLFYTGRLLKQPRGAALVAAVRQKRIETLLCSEAVLDELSATVASQAVVAVVEKPHWEFSGRGFSVIADQIRDPGNLGALMRTAAGVGAAGLLIVSGSVDVYSPKVLRASMGAIFQLPHAVFSRREILELINRAGAALVVADLEDARDYTAVTYPQNVAIVIGNEAHGVDPLFRCAAAFRVRIPLAGGVESLNASVAAGVLLYEILRQHRCNKPGSMV